MGLRGFVQRRRLMSTVAAPLALGVAVAATAWLTYDPPIRVDPTLTASVTECHDMVTVAIAGRGDTPIAGTTKMLEGADRTPLPAALTDDYQSNWVDQVITAPAGAVNAAKPGSYASVYIAYPADMNSYDEAVATGVTNT